MLLCQLDAGGDHTAQAQTAPSKANCPIHNPSKGPLLCFDTYCLLSLLSSPAGVAYPRSASPPACLWPGGKRWAWASRFPLWDYWSWKYGKRSQSAVRARVTGLLTASWVALWQILPFPGATWTALYASSRKSWIKIWWESGRAH